MRSSADGAEARPARSRVPDARTMETRMGVDERAPTQFSPPRANGTPLSRAQRFVKRHRVECSCAACFCRR
jgi:hypothetical protein